MIFDSLYPEQAIVTNSRGAAQDSGEWRRTRTVVAPRLSMWQAWQFRHLRLDLAWQVYFRDLGDKLGLLWRRGFLRSRRGTIVAGVVLSGPL